MNPYFKEYSDFLAEHFSGKIQKISIDLALGCPNRDGSLGRGGCIYCNNTAFSPDSDKSSFGVAAQIERGKQFFARKYPTMRYLAYFQSYTSTYGAHPRLLKAYAEALADADTVGIVIGTRPDCMPDELLSELKKLAQESGKEILIEFGVETMHDKTLEFINRHHTAAQARDAIMRTAHAGFSVGVHLILGLPGENEQMYFETVDAVNSLPISTLKFHQLQILEATPLASMYRDGLSVALFTPNAYADLCVKLLDRLRPDIAIDRFVAQAPAHLLIAPKWGLKNYEFREILLRKLKEREALRK
ncbi:MAG: TIGR01212 family radical SAM protein [Bacteroidales bacterium]|nr:TIGR01212 family radical SAM protein [Bacteroidales bacterium]